MATDMAAIRAKLAQNNFRKPNSTNPARDSSFFPFYDTPVGETTVLRFLPDGNPDNTFFWVEKQIIKIPFVGIVGGDPTQRVELKVPCVEQWGDKCPIHDELRPMFGTAQEEQARQYWKKRSYLMQGFVQTTGVQEKEPPANPIRKFNFTTQIFNIIKSSLLDPDLEVVPTDFFDGLDFKVTKQIKSQWADYSTSSWSRKSTPLTDQQMAAINQFGLFDLATLLPEKPTPEHLGAQYEMFIASMNGEQYDPARWAKYYKPYGLDIIDNDTKSSAHAAPVVQVYSAPTQAVVQTPSATQEPVQPAPVTTSNKTTQDIVNALLARNRG